ncbi:hypothetical protein NG798_25760 [Ancylothrix sp. C2]|uniref:hypothetical protein n=1 Tax=Ancylothrix sp. D3o TaxID=2953691 RepID=UPI0021BAFF16|nr:hypothetical protein [Ancylothrix sp. D3o]MCT7953208.1 hypothetical protein [Ancylothrix sp. D3o]
MLLAWVVPVVARNPGKPMMPVVAGRPMVGGRPVVVVSKRGVVGAGGAGGVGGSGEAGNFYFVCAGLKWP